MIEPIRFSAFVAPHLNKTRVDAQWARIAERRPVGRKLRSALIPAVGVLVVACALTVVWWPRETRSSNESVWEGSVVASDEAPVGMTLAEGTRIKVEPRSEVKLLRSSSSAVQVRLTHGSARFVVAKKPSRRFSVNVGEVEVVVTGTQFRVVRKPSGPGDRVQVEVDEGSVEVRRGEDGVVTLHAGEQWSTMVAREPPTPGEAMRGASDDERDDERENENENEAGVEDAELATDDSSRLDADDDGDENRRPRESSRARRRRRARDAAEGAAQLFDHANLARRVGRLEDAVSMYGELVARYPRDRRASLAAFELGRLRMDSLRDMRGAVRALERALRLDAHGTFAEDALARLVLAEEAQNDHAGCNRARSRYLARYPEGVHAQHVAERCGH